MTPGFAKRQVGGGSDPPVQEEGGGTPHLKTGADWVTDFRAAII